MRAFSNWADEGGAARIQDYRNELANGARVLGTVVILISLYTALSFGPFRQVAACLAVYLCVGLLTLLSQFLASEALYGRVIGVQLVADVVMFTIGIHFSGSMTSILVLLYPLLVVIATLGWGVGRGAFAMGLIAFCYGALLLLEGQEVLAYDPFWPDHLELWFSRHLVWTHYPRWLFSASIYTGVVGITYLLYRLTRYILYLLERTQAEMVRQEGMVAIGELTAGAAHELNNPLGSAGSLLETLIEEIRDAPEQALSREVRGELLETAERASRSVRRAHQVTRELLDLSRQSFAEREPVHLERILQDAVEKLRLQYPEKASAVEFRSRGGFPAVHANALQISQVVFNIADNAVQVVPLEGGRVELGLLSEPGRVAITCEDNGPGMAPELLEKIFRPFFSTKEKGRGTGLGLFLCQEIVHRLGGEIRVLSHVGRGTRFEIRLPVASE